MSIILRALREARGMIETERAAFIEFNAWPDGSLRGPDAEICAQYDHVIDLLRAALEAAQREPAQTTPPGYRTVPVEPTPEMLRAAQTEWMRDRLKRTTTMWAAMLAAAPDSAALCAHDEEGPR
jgi:hypothetical protein